jgi:peptidoglycan/LPS O-acetylase OafA/YrhL
MTISAGIRDDIQTLRGIAVLMVVLFHLQAPLFANGFIGVDIFFVISGYLMAKLYEGRTPAEFYRKRADRLFAGYALTISATLGVGFFVAMPVDFDQLVAQTIAAIFVVPNIHYWNQNSYFDKTAFNPLLHLWSLGVEIQFYLLVPFLYPLLRRRPVLFAATFAGSLVVCVAAQFVSPKTAFFLLPFRIWEFLIGAGIAWYARVPADRTPRGEWPRRGLAAALLALPSAVALRPEAAGSIVYGHPSAFAFVMTAATAAILAVGFPMVLRDGPVARVLRWLGDRSYAIYLAHFPAVVLLNYAPFGGTRLHFGSLGALAAGLVAIAALSLALHRLADGAWRPALRPTWRKIGILTTCLAVTFLLHERSWAGYAPELRNVLSAWTDRDVYRCGKLFRILNPVGVLCPLDAGDDGKRVLLLGNSHADSIKRGFAQAARADGFATYFAVPNDPLMPGGWSAAQTFDLTAARRFDAVVLHYSNVYADERIAGEIAAFLRANVAAGVPAILIGPVPAYGVQVPKAMFADPRAPAFPVEITLDAHRDRTTAFRAFARGLEAEGIVVLDPAPLLCPPDGTCRYAGADFKPYYFDDSHMTLTGAEQLRALFEAAVARARR